MAKRSQIRATEKQMAVWEYIVTHVEKHGYQPTVAEIAAAFGVDPKAISERLKALEQKRYIRLPGTGRERCIVLNRIRFKRQFAPATPTPSHVGQERKLTPDRTESTPDEGHQPSNPSD